MNCKNIEGYEKYKIYENGDVYLGEKRIELFIHNKIKNIVLY